MRRSFIGHYPAGGHDLQPILR